MRYHTFLSLALVAWSIGNDPGPPVGASPQDHGLDDAILGKMVERVSGFVSAGWIVGAELLISHRDHTVLHRAFGMQDRESDTAMEPGTLFNIRSMAKPLVGSMAQRQIEAGRIALDDPVSRYLPSFADGASARITVEHLLTHTSGLPDGNPAGRPSDYPTLRSIADYWGGHGPTEFEPGEGFLYSDPGADVLGVVLEVVSGRPLHELARKEVFEPLGMKDSTALLDDWFSADRQFASLYSPGPAGDWRRVWKAGDGSIAPFTIGSGTTWYATPADYTRFLSGWLGALGGDGGGWLTRAAAERALDPGPMMSYANQVPGTRAHYGQMWQVYVAGDGYQEGERIAFGHSGSDGTYAWVWPDQELIVCYFTQSRGQRTRLLLEQLIEELARTARQTPGRRGVRSAASGSSFAGIRDSRRGVDWNEGSSCL